MLDATSGTVPPDSESEKYGEFPLPFYSLQAENRKLVDMNRDLMSQVRVLQNQFDDAVTITDGLKTRFMSHHNTLRELHAVTLERDDLRERLGMCQRYNEDLLFEMQKLKQQKEPVTVKPAPAPPPPLSPSPAPALAPAPVKVVPDPALTATIEGLKVRLQTVEEENKQLKAAKEGCARSHREKMERVLAALSRFVGRSFASNSDAVNFLLNERDTYESVSKKVTKHRQAKSELEAKLRARDRKINALASEKDTLARELTSEIQSLQRRNQEMSEELTTPRTMVSPSISPVKVVTIAPTPAVSAAPNVISDSHYIGSGDEAQEEAMHQRQMITSLQDERSKLQDLLERQTNLTCSLEKKIKQKDNEGKKLALELRRAQMKVNKLSKYENNTPKVPMSIWMCPEFPDDLAKIIEDMAKNTALQLPTKIRHALTTVTNWFLSREEVMQKQWHEDKDALVDLRRKVDTFAEYLQHVIPMDIDFHYVILDESVRGCFGRELVMMKNQLNDLKEEMRQWSVVQDLLNHVSPVDAKERIKELIENEAHLTQRLEDVQHEHEEKCERMEARFEKLTGESKAKEMRMKKRIEELQKEVDDMKSMVMGRDEFEARIAREADQKCSTIAQQMSEMQNQLASTQSEIEAAKRVISHLRKKKQRAEDEVRRQKEAAKEMRQRLKSKKDRLNKQMSELLEKMQRQASEHQQAIHDMNARIEVVNSEKMALSNKVEECTLVMQRMESKMNNAVAKCDREKRQVVSAYTAKVQSVQAEYEHKLQEAHEQGLMWKMAVYDKIATALAKHLNGVRKIDDGNVEVVMQVLGRKLDSAIQTDRLIRSYLDISQYDAIDAALEAAGRPKHRKLVK